MDYSSRIKELRKKRKLTQSELAQKLNIDQSAIHFWEAGKTCPDIQKLMLLADIFEVSVGYILGKEDIIYPKPPAPGSVPEDVIRYALLGNSGEETDKQWAEVQQFVKFIRQRDTNDS
jgi:transcriptional regulator with XRE-family HTH domain